MDTTKGGRVLAELAEFLERRAVPGAPDAHAARAEVLRLFHRVTGSLPAYRDFLRRHGVDPATVRTFAVLPGRRPRPLPLRGEASLHARTGHRMREVRIGPARTVPETGVPRISSSAVTEMRIPDSWVVVGLDNGGTSNNATVLDASGRFLVDRLAEVPSRVQEGPDAAVEALVQALDNVLELSRTPREAVRAVGLDSPGPASADGVISSKGATNFAQQAWWGFDFRSALENRLELPVVYNNDGNAAALYAHHVRFGAESARHSSISAIVGTGLGGGVVEAGHVVRGASGMAGELGHVQIPMQGLLEEGQPVPVCNCGFAGDVESVASLTGIENNLLPYWLTRFPDHDLAHAESPGKAAKLVRAYAENRDPLALKIFEQQAMALGRLFTIAANFTDPTTYFVGGGVVETVPWFRDWFLDKVREHSILREEQERAASFALVPDLDMAGARGAAVAAFDHCRDR
jgi:predicted NBD/HSP70 family sugar kinase